MKLFTLAAVLLVTATALAETTYTNLEQTPVRDKPAALGKVIATLPSGSMIETIKVVGAYTNVSFIQDGKVKNGFIANAQLGNGDAKAGGKMNAVEAAQTSVGQEDVGAMVNGLTDNPEQAATDKANSLKSANMPAGAEDPGAMLQSKLDSYQIPSSDLESFAKSGKLVSRRPKSKVQ